MSGRRREQLSQGLSRGVCEGTEGRAPPPPRSREACPAILDGVMGEVPRNPHRERRRKRERSKNKETNRQSPLLLSASPQSKFHNASRTRFSEGGPGAGAGQARGWGAALRMRGPQRMRPAQEAGRRERAWGASGTEKKRGGDLGAAARRLARS